MRSASALLILLGLGQPALASPPCECLGPQVFPGHESAEVPINVRPVVHLGWRAGAEVHLHDDASGDEIAASATALDVRGQWVRLIPSADLAPGTWYRLEIAHASPWSQRFVTGTTADTAPPTWTTLTIEGASLPGACEDNLAARVMGLAADDLTPQGDLFYRIALEGPGGARSVYASTAMPSLGRMLSGGREWVDCLDSVPDAQEGGSYQAVLRVVDLAGNESAPTDPIAFTFVAGEGASWGCAVGRAAPPSALAAVLLAAALVLAARRPS